MKETMKEWIIIDSSKNIITFDPLDKELPLQQIIWKNMNKAKRINTFKELDKTLREILKDKKEGSNNE